MSRRAAAARRTAPPAMGVPAAADRRFRRPDVRPSGGRSVRLTRRVVVFGVLGLVVLVGVGLGIRAFLTSQWFEVRQITVHGTTRMSAAEVEGLVSDLHHDNILLADIDHYRHALLDSPWIGDVTIRRQLPSTVAIEVTERVPMILAHLADRVYLVDRTGAIIDEAGPQYRDFDLPVVDGLGVTDPSGRLGVDKWRVSLVERFLNALGAAPTLRARISQIDVSDAHDVTVMLERDSTAVRLGDAHFVDRLQRYLALVPALREKLADLDYVDVRFDNNLFVMPRGRVPVAAGSGTGPHAVKRP
jgi:cell division septal protein FtsQ